MDILKLTGARIRELRKLQGLSQEALAERAGLHMVYLGGMERGERNITLENLAKIAQALNVEVMELLNFNSSGTEDDDIIVAVTAALRDRSTEDKRRILQIINLIPKSGE